MRTMIAVCAAATLVTALTISLRSQAGATLYDNARLVIGDGTTVENGALLVQGGRIVAAGRRADLRAPAGTTRVDLSGKTVMPALVNAHVHIGYEGYTSWSAANYTPANILNHLQRQAYYGVAATQTVGSSPTDASLDFVRDQQAGKFPPASRFLFVPGMAPPGGGPDAILIRGTNVLRAVYEVTTGAEARAAVQSMAAKGLRHVKIWVDDRRGTYPKMTPEVYNASISEAHTRGMVVHAHAIQLADQKIVIRAGADVLVHTVGAERIDDELVALVREKRPSWTTVIGLGDLSEACGHDPFVDDTYPKASLEEIHERDCGPRPNAATRDANLSYNVKTMVAAGARLVLGTDAGIDARHAFGWADHHEMARWVQFGVTPAEAIVAATSRPAELLGLSDLGTLAPGKSADFLVLNANPLDDIRNTRQIANVYLKGLALDRAAMAREFRRDAAR